MLAFLLRQLVCYANHFFMPIDKSAFVEFVNNMDAWDVDAMSKHFGTTPRSISRIWTKCKGEVDEKVAANYVLQDSSDVALAMLIGLPPPRKNNRGVRTSYKRGAQKKRAIDVDTDEQVPEEDVSQVEQPPSKKCKIDQPDRFVTICDQPTIANVSLDNVRDFVEAYDYIMSVRHLI